MESDNEEDFSREMYERVGRRAEELRGREDLVDEAIKARMRSRALAARILRLAKSMTQANSALSDLPPGMLHKQTDSISRLHEISEELERTTEEHETLIVESMALARVMTRDQRLEVEELETAGAEAYRRAQESGMDTL